MADSDAPITELLDRWRSGDEDAFHRLVELVYPVLRQIATSRLKQARPGSRLQTTELVNEAYFRLARQTRTQWVNRNHFFAVASTVLRRVVVDHARHSRRDKRGAGFEVAPLGEEPSGTDPAPVDWLDLDACLVRFETVDPVASKLIELRYFTGLSVEDAAEALDIGRTTAVRKWRLARSLVARGSSRVVESCSIWFDEADGHLGARVHCRSLWLQGFASRSGGLPSIVPEVGCREAIPMCWYRPRSSESTTRETRCA
ncbi:MAG: ECF-type sigma factor [Thermoanaerobaculia bacterium]|nr:ECF-type sigma factor [Thermoanaerobaculia bacterium]